MAVKRYEAGDPIPENILDVEPIGPSGPRPALTFGAVTDVCDAGDRFILVVVDADWRGPVGQIEGEHGHVCVFAPTKEVVLVCATQHIIPSRDDDGKDASGRPVRSPAIA